MRSKHKVIFLFFWIISFVIPLRLVAGTVDSTDQGFVAQMEAFFNESSKKSKQDVDGDRATIRQNQIMEEIKAMGRQSRFFLRKNPDSTVNGSCLKTTKRLLLK